MTERLFPGGRAKVRYNGRCLGLMLAGGDWARQHFNHIPEAHATEPPPLSEEVKRIRRNLEKQIEGRFAWDYSQPWHETTRDTTPGPTTASATVESLKQAVREFSERFPNIHNMPRRLLMTSKAFEKIAEEAPEATMDAPTGEAARCHLFGLPVETFETRLEMLWRSIELNWQGIPHQVVMDEEGEKETDG